MPRDWNSLVRQMDEWGRSMDRFMDRMQQVACTQQPTPSLALECWRPAVNVCETPEKVVVLVELAGVEPKDISIQAQSNQLIFEGQRLNRMPESVQRLHQIEIWSGSFSFQIPLPALIDPTQADANYQAGFLEVKLTKLPLTAPANRQGGSQLSGSIRIHTHGEMLL